MDCDPVGRFLAYTFESAFMRWATLATDHYEPNEVKRYERWLAWLELDLAGRAAAAHVGTEGYIETERRFGRCDIDGRFLLFPGDEEVPMRVPESHGAWWPGLRQRQEAVVA